MDVSIRWLNELLIADSLIRRQVYWITCEFLEWMWTLNKRKSDSTCKLIYNAKKCTSTNKKAYHLFMWLIWILILMKFSKQVESMNLRVIQNINGFYCGHIYLSYCIAIDVRNRGAVIKCSVLLYSQKCSSIILKCITFFFSVHLLTWAG